MNGKASGRTEKQTTFLPVPVELTQLLALHVSITGDSNGFAGTGLLRISTFRLIAAAYTHLQQVNEAMSHNTVESTEHLRRIARRCMQSDERQQRAV